MTWPVTHDPSSESRNVTMEAMSSAVPMRLERAIRSMRAFPSSGRSSSMAWPGTIPGATALARMPSRPQREAMWRTTAVMPVLVVA
jgi:hypothetical protein